MSDYAEVREFLERHGFVIAHDGKVNHLSISKSGLRWWGHETKNFWYFYQAALNHWLVGELGRNWQQVFRGMTLIRESLHQDFGFDERQWDEIRSAFALWLLLEVDRKESTS